MQIQSGKMQNRLGGWLVVAAAGAAFCLLAVMPSPAQAPAYKAPKTKDGKADLNGIPDRAVHTVRTDNEPGAELAAVVERYGRSRIVLSQLDQRTRAQYGAAELQETLEQDLLGHGLRHHERVRVGRRQPIEGDGHEHAVAITDGEATRLKTPGDQPPRNVKRLQHLERTGMHHRGSRGVFAFDKAVHQDRSDALRGQSGR